MFTSKEEKLKTLASRGDSLAQYYLGRYYLEEKHSVDQGLIWLLKSSFGDPRYANNLLNKLAKQYKSEIQKIKQSLLSI